MLAYQGLSFVAMAKPSVIRAEQPLAPDLSADSILASSTPSSRRRDIVFVVNPRGANGRTGEQWEQLLPYIRTRLGSDYNICESFTSNPYHAVDITREAIREGADAVVAVGGDGTLHEVVNGFFWGRKLVSTCDLQSSCRTALGLIPLGTGSDFARTFSWKNNPYDAVDRIAGGRRCRISVGAVSGEGGDPHYFLNVADIHLSAKAGYYSSSYKQFGNLCYVIGALQAFLQHCNRDIRIKVDGGEWELCSQVTAICIGNAKYFGGGMKITPNADPVSADFEVIILQDFKWAQTLEVEEIIRGENIYVQSDGEHLGFLPRKFWILPGAIEMIC